MKKLILLFLTIILLLYALFKGLFNKIMVLVWFLRPFFVVWIVIRRIFTLGICKFYFILILTFINRIKIHWIFLKNIDFSSPVKFLFILLALILLFLIIINEINEKEQKYFLLVLFGSIISFSTLKLWYSQRIFKNYLFELILC
jgi:hypothetical protein